MKPKKIIITIFTAISVLWALPLAFASATSAEPTQFSWMDIFIGIAGGLAFFLYGMDKMSNGMKTTAGNKMRTILATLTKNRFIALVVGAFVTMVIQSSSATTVMLVSFVQAGLLNLSQSMGVILGADIGTTITAQMIAFKLTDYALLMVAIGFLLKMFGKTEKSKAIGDIILGFGILFFGMKLMSDVMKPLRTYPAFINLMKDLENPFMGILIGAVFTSVVFSASESSVLTSSVLISPPSVFTSDCSGLSTSIAWFSVGSSLTAVDSVAALVSFDGSVLTLKRSTKISKIAELPTRIWFFSGITSIAATSPQQLLNASMTWQQPWPKT